MHVISAKSKSATFMFLVCSGLVMPAVAYAYVDPGTTGLLTQLLYVLFYGVIGVFFYCLRHIRQTLANGKRYLFGNLFKSKTQDHQKS
jgi:hypothetical protein